MKPTDCYTRTVERQQAYRPTPTPLLTFVLLQDSHSLYVLVVAGRFGDRS